MTMQKTLHPTVDIDKTVCVKKEGGKGLANIEDSSIRRNEDNIKKEQRKTDYSEHKYK